MVEVRPCTIAEIEQVPNLAELLAEYAAESAIEGLAQPGPQLGMYKTLETAGVICAFGAFQDDLLVGFITVITHLIPHYAGPISATESFFVAGAYRKTGAGTLLRRAAERHAQSRGCAGLLISAPYGGTLAQVLPKAGYRQTNEVFFKRLSND